MAGNQKLGNDGLIYIMETLRASMESAVGEANQYTDGAIQDIELIPGRGIKSTVTMYQIGNSSKDSPSGTWSETPQDTTNENPFLWAKIVMTYTDGTVSVSYTVSKKGDDGQDGDPGKDGISVIGITPEYYLSTSSTEPTGGLWDKELPLWSSGCYIWKRFLVDWSDNTQTYTEAAIDKSVNHANEAAEYAKQQAADAQSSAGQAQASAASANSAAQTAATNAASAQTTAQEATENADIAKLEAEAAKKAANEANAEVEVINTEITGIKEDAVKIRGELVAEVETITETMEASYTKKTELTETEASLKSELSKSVAQLQSTMASDFAKKTDVAEVQSNLQTQVTQNANSITSTAKSVEAVRADVTDAKAAADAAQSSASAAQTTANTAKTNADNAKKAADSAEAAAKTAQTKASEAQTAADNAKKAADNADAVAQAAQTDLDAAKKNLETVTNRVGATEEEIAAAQEAVDTAQQAANKAKEDATKANNAAAAAQTTANTAKTDAANAQTAAANAKTAADNAQTAADAAQDAAEKAQADVNSLAPRVTTAETKIDQNAKAIALRATQTEVTEAIAGIQVGGRNLLRGTAKPTTLTAPNTSNYTYLHKAYDPEPNTQYTVSGKIEVVSGSFNKISIYGCYDKAYAAVDISGGSFVYTFTTPSPLPSRSDSINKEILLYAGIAGATAGNSVIFRELKLEKGNKATDWSPAPEDTETEIATVNSTVADLEVSVEGISGKVTSTENDLKNLTSRVSTAEQKITPDAIISTVSGTYATKDKVKEVETTATQTANKFNWIVKSGTSASDFTLTDRVAQLTAQQINLNGLVSFSGLDSTAQGKINIASANASNALSTANAAKLATEVETISGNLKKFKNVCGYTSDSSDKKGALIITTPITPSRMVSVHIKGYNYVDGQETIDLTVGFYNYSNGMVRTGYINNGSLKLTPIKVAKVSSSDTRAVIIIGDATTTWQYPKIIVDEVITGFSTVAPDSYKDGFSATITTLIPTTYAQVTTLSGTDVKTLLNSVKSVSDDNGKLLASWCAANDKTLINGGKIFAGSIGAKQISVNSLEAICAKIGGFTIGGTYLANNATKLAGAANSVYLGTDGISCGTGFQVDNKGKLKAVNAELSCNINMNKTLNGVTKTVKLGNPYDWVNTLTNPVLEIKESVSNDYTVATQVDSRGVEINNLTVADHISRKTYMTSKSFGFLAYDNSAGFECPELYVEFTETRGGTHQICAVNWHDDPYDYDDPFADCSHSLAPINFDVSKLTIRNSQVLSELICKDYVTTISGKYKKWNSGTVQYAGYVTITPSAANTPTAVVAKWPAAISNPMVVVSAQSGVPGKTVTGVSFSAQTSTQCNIWLCRTNTTATNVYFMVM